MTNLISIIGTIASIGSIPLAVYLYFKSSEAAKDRVRRNIVKIISFQIGNSRMPTLFEIQSVIRSECRLNKLKLNSIDHNDVIEELVTEIISSPILAPEIKDSYVQKLNLIYTKGEILSLIDNLTEQNNNSESNEKNIKELLEKHVHIDGEIEKKFKEANVNSIQLFGLYAAFITFILSSVSIFSSNLYISRISELINSNKGLVNIFLSILAVLVAALVTFITRKGYSKKDK